jgi:hypothetical protein
MPVGPAQFPGQSNTYVKDHAASNYLITQFSRNIKDFPLNRYIQYQDVNKDTGYYLRLNVEQAGRLKDGKMDAYYWPDGADRPRTHDGTEKFNWADYRCQRFDFPFMLGWKSRDQAGFDLQDVELANHAQQAMTGRTLRVHKLLETNSYWDASHRKDVVSGIPGNTGRWDQSTTTRSDIKRSINFAIDVIRRDTLAAVKQKKDMVLVMNPKTAQRLGESQEMINAFIQSRYAMSQFTGKESEYSDYGLPERLYGIEVVVEDSVMTTSARDSATVVKQDVCADGVVYLLSRPGGLVSKSNSGPNFSTIMSFLYEDMTTETLDDTNNRRTEGHIVDDSAEVLTAPVSGFKFENVVG